MGNNQRIAIGDKTITREQLFRGKDDFRKEQAKPPFEARMGVLIELQKIAYSWGEKKDVVVWKQLGTVATFMENKNRYGR